MNWGILLQRLAGIFLIWILVAMVWDIISQYILNRKSPFLVAASAVLGWIFGLAMLLKKLFDSMYQ